MITLVTGASGFLGQYIVSELSNQLNCEIYSLGRGNNSICLDLTDSTLILPNIQFNCVIHLAGKAHSYPKTIAEIQEFELVNYQGTINLLNALEAQTALKVFVFASTVSVYGVESGDNLNESFTTNPITPYGKSKLDAENAIISWCTKRNIKYLILRLPLIAGENPLGNLGAMKKAIQKGYYLRIKGNQARKSMVLASDVAKLIVNFDGESGIYHLTDGYNPTFKEIESAFEKSLNRKIKINIPLPLLKFFAFMGDNLQKIGIKLPFNTLTLNKLTSSLTFNDDKAKKELGWKPNSVIDYLSNN